MEEKQSFFKKIKAGLEKTREQFLGGVNSVLAKFTKIDDELFDELEETLILSDFGPSAAEKIISAVKTNVKKQGVTEPKKITALMRDEIARVLSGGEGEGLITPAVILLIGVNGVGKTTTAGKLAYFYKNAGKKVLLAAADTFRAAAIEQLEICARKAGVNIIKHAQNSDPASVVYDALQAARAAKTDVLICDTAGRLHNKKNLMEELKKIRKIIDSQSPERAVEVYLTLDAVTGQNGLRQAEAFFDFVGLSGLILTKIDGTAKGGAVVAITDALHVPVRFLGVGEGIGDLREFNAAEFAEGIFEN